jgi:UDP-N-acetylglucosamine 2-epimerase (non-hydrolysing)
MQHHRFDQEQVPHRICLVTIHRRESIGSGIGFICRALEKVAALESSVCFKVLMHPNSQVRSQISGLLSGHNRIQLVEPVAYQDAIKLLMASPVLLTDSGGLLEDAATLNRFSIVMRERCERPEALNCGLAVLTGFDPDRIVEATVCALKEQCVRPAGFRHIYGDGLAAARIVNTLSKIFGLEGFTEDASGFCEDFGASSLHPFDVSYEIDG